eukprot:scaffold29298_cov152-Skeletonema_dohrnii-CCMP3373.AAC.11
MSNLPNSSSPFLDTSLGGSNSFLAGNRGRTWPGPGHEMATSHSIKWPRSPSNENSSCGRLLSSVEAPQQKRNHSPPVGV